MTVRLEHANLFVRDIDATIRFLQTAFPEFRIRFDGKDPRGFRWVHIGTDNTYIALTQSTAEPEQRWTPYVGVPGVNHLAYEVDDVEVLRERLQSAGYKCIPLGLKSIGLEINREYFMLAKRAIPKLSRLVVRGLAAGRTPQQKLLWGFRVRHRDS